MRPSYLYNGNSYTGNTASLQWDGSQNSVTARNWVSHFMKVFEMEASNTNITDVHVGSVFLFHGRIMEWMFIFHGRIMQWMFIFHGRIMQWCLYFMVGSLTWGEGLISRLFTWGELRGQRPRRVVGWNRCCWLPGTGGLHTVSLPGPNMLLLIEIVVWHDGVMAWKRYC